MSEQDNDVGSLSGRIFAVLEVLAMAEEPLILSDVGRRVKLPVSTTHRFLADLAKCGAVERIDGKRFQLGERVWQLGMAVSRERELWTAAALSIP